MPNSRAVRRAAFGVASIAALLATAACGGAGPTAGGGSGASGAPSAAAAMEGVGPITYVQGKDTGTKDPATGKTTVQSQIDAWNSAHPDQKVTLVELSDKADEQFTAMVNNCQAKGASNYDILNVDVVWTAQFAANGCLAELPKDQIDLNNYLPAAVDASSYFNKLYAMPSTSDGALLYYRKDLLDAAGVTAAPKTWDEMQAACKAVKAKNPGIECYGGQFQKYEGLTCNIAEWINSAGGEFLTADGKPAVNSEASLKGVEALVTAFKDGTIPKAGLTWTEEPSRNAFQEGKLVFLRNWPYVYSHAQNDSTSVVKDKFAVAPIPGLTGPGVSTLGGHNMGISSFTKNKKTALEFILWWNNAENQKQNLLINSSAPTWVPLYDDSELVAKFPYLPFLKASIGNAKARPKAVKYNDVTNAIQDAAYNAISGNGDAKALFDTLQQKLTDLTK